MRRTRRSLLAALLALPPALALMPRSGAAQAPLLAPTPACGDNDEPTPSQIAGPYYKPSSPKRRDLRTEIGHGEPIDLAGQVLDTHCRPVAGTVVEIWHADDAGVYDNAGFRLRGYQLTDAAGRWGFETLVTKHYAGRTAHYHFRIVRPGGGALITQLYFPDHPRNASDRMFDARLVMRTSRRAERQQGHFDFVLPSA